MNNVLIVHTSWYENYVSQMIKASSEILNNDFECFIAKAPGAIEMAELGFTYEQILNHYYQGTKIKEIEILSQ